MLLLKPGETGFQDEGRKRRLVEKVLNGSTTRDEYLEPSGGRTGVDEKEKRHLTLANSREYRTPQSRSQSRTSR
jgi:hypothetical protein